MEPVSLALMSMIPQLVGGAVSYFGHKKYADTIADLKLDTPSGLTEAEKILRGNVNRGLPGYETMKGDILGSIPQTLEGLKEMASNPAAVIGGLNDAQSNVTSELSDLAVKDAMAKLASNSQLAQFLSGTKANFQTAQQQYANDVKMSVAKERLMGLQEAIGGVSQGVTSGMSSYGNFTALENYKGMYNPWTDFINNTGNTGDANPAGSPMGYNFSWDKVTQKSLMDAIMKFGQ